MITLLIFSIYLTLIYLLIRNYEVFKFRMSLSHEEWRKLPSYESMLFSFKKLTKKNWLKV